MVVYFCFGYAKCSIMASTTKLSHVSSSKSKLSLDGLDNNKNIDIGDILEQLVMVPMDNKKNIHVANAKQSKCPQSNINPKDVTNKKFDDSKENIGFETHNSKHLRGQEIFGVKLNAVKLTHANKKYNERSPKVEPIVTIMGLSNSQIYKLKVSDIRLKKIVSQASKTLFTILDFIMTHEILFEKDEIRNSFVMLCSNIAIYEAKGLKKTLQRYGNIVETWGQYNELTLNYTHTKITESDKQMHQNNLDYSILSYIGNILIWLSFSENLNLFDQTLIKANFGGYHLWDQLFKEKSINMKRWKHIIKFKENFSYQPNQFVLVAKFLHIDIHRISRHHNFSSNYDFAEV